MRATAGLLPLLALLGAGCAQSPHAIEHAGELALSKEMSRLGRLVGAWAGTGEVLTPVAAPAVARPGMETAAIRLEGGSVYSWVLGGAYLKAVGWHETLDGKREHFVEYVTWDPREGKYLAWWFSDRGQRGRRTITLEGDEMRSSVDGSHPDGTPLEGKGVVTFVGEDETRWTWTEKTPQGEVRLRGTMTRRR